MKYFTTLKKLRENDACSDRYPVLVDALCNDWEDDRPIPLLTILKLNGIDDAIWALRAVNGIDKESRLFACDCAEHVLSFFEKQYPKDKRPRNAIKAAKDYAKGLGSFENMAAAARAAWDAAGAAGAAGAARAAARAAGAARAARAAAWAAGAAAWAAERKWQEELFIKYFTD